MPETEDLSTVSQFKQRLGALRRRGARDAKADQEIEARLIEPTLAEPDLNNREQKAKKTGSVITKPFYYVSSQIKQGFNWLLNRRKAKENQGAAARLIGPNSDNREQKAKQSGSIITKPFYYATSRLKQGLNWLLNRRKAKEDQEAKARLIEPDLTEQTSTSSNRQASKFSASSPFSYVAHQFKQGFGLFNRRKAKLEEEQAVPST